MYTWIWVTVALLLGALLGGLGFFLYARERFADAARARELERQLEGYKQEVSDHFLQTAELVNNLTHSYKAVFDHLEQGAYRLVDEETLRKQLGDVDAESVRLEYIGRRNKASVLGAGTATGESTAAGPVQAEPTAAAPESYSRFETGDSEPERESEADAPQERESEPAAQPERESETAAPQRESEAAAPQERVTHPEEVRHAEEERS